MAKPTTMRWSKLSIWPGNGATPEVFTANVCGLTAKELSISGATTDQVVPDCDDPDQPAWVERIVRSLSGSVTGSGLLAEENFPYYRDWALSGFAKNVRIVVDSPTTPGYFAGSFVMSRFNITGNESDGKMNVAITMDSDGPITYTTGTP